MHAPELPLENVVAETPAVYRQADKRCQRRRLLLFRACLTVPGCRQQRWKSECTELEVGCIYNLYIRISV